MKTLTHKIICGALSTCLLLTACSSAIPAMATEKEPSFGSVSLYALAPTAQEGGTLQTGKRSDGEAFSIAGGYETLGNICLTPSGTAAASVSYDISTIKAETFSAVVGKDSSAYAGGTGHTATYSVYADSAKIATAEKLDYGKAQELSAEIPSGTKTLKLEVDPVDGADYDSCVFGNAAVSYKLPGSGYVDMTAITPDRVICDGDLATNALIKIGSRNYPKGFMSIPQMSDDKGQTSELYFDVSRMDVKTLTATVGLSGTASTDGAIFMVYADGQKVYDSGVVTSSDAAKDITADVSGANLITLTVNNNGNNTGDMAVWANPRLSLDASEPLHITDAGTMSLTDIPWTTAISESKDPQVNKPYENNADYKIKVGGIEYNYGISAHPYNNDTPSKITYDISSMNCTTFTVKVGKTEEKTISATRQDYKEQFMIYCDGVLATQSEPITMGHYTQLSVDVTGIHTLVLAIDACGNYSAGACAWCEPTFYYALPEGSVKITSPVTAFQRSTFGDEGTAISGTTRGVTNVEFKSGERVLGKVNTNSAGKFTFDVPADMINSGSNTITAVAYKGAEQTGHTDTVVLEKSNKYSVMNMTWKSTTGYSTLLKNAGPGVRRSYLSVGSQTHLSETGFCIKPNDMTSTPADVVIDLASAGKKVSFFQSLVGIDDFSPVANGEGVGGTVQYFVLAGDTVLAQTSVLGPNEIASVACAIPEGTTELTLRVSNADNNNYLDYADWIDPCVFISADDYGSVNKDLYSENNLGANRTLTAEGSVGVRFVANQSFTAITLKPEAASNSVIGRLYRFTYSYTRSVQNGELSVCQTKKNNDGTYTFTLNDDYEAGEYLFVADGVTKIAANGSQYGYSYADGCAIRGLINMSVLFCGVSDSYLGTPSDEPSVISTTAKTTANEKARAKEIYEKYTNDLANFPCTFKIGDTTYTGFGDEFKLKDKKTSASDMNHSETIDFTFTHSSGLEFTLTTVFYPEYAAFDWVINFKNTASTDSPIVTDLIPCTVQFEGDDPTILGSYGDDLGTTAPYTPLDTYLDDGETATFAPNCGRSTDGAFPYYNFEYGDKGALIAVSWSSTWESSFSYKNGVTNFTDKQKTFYSYLEPDENARTPLTAMILYDGRDTDRATNLWRSWFLDCNMYKPDEKNVQEPFMAGVSSVLTAEMMSATDANQIQYIEGYISRGIPIKVWWMDAGWYQNGNDSSYGIQPTWLVSGNWSPDASRFPSKMKSISNYANSQGVKTLLWFEPERAGIYFPEEQEDAGIAPRREWYVGYNAQTGTDYGSPGYRQLDMGNKECLEWVKSSIGKTITEGGISMYREDLNNAGMGQNFIKYNNDHPTRAGMCENGCVQGHYEFWDYILSIGVELIDSCASGGHRLDLESVRRAVALHPTDYTYADNTAKQIASYNISAWIPFAGANTGLNTGSVDEYILRSAFRQALILQYDSVHLSEANLEKLKAGTDEWSIIKDFYYGNAYELTKCTVSTNEWYSYSYIDPDTQNGFAMVYRREGIDSPEEQYIKFKGLMPNNTYTVTFAESNLSYTMSGRELMYRGINEKLVDARSSDIIYVNCTKTGTTSSMTVLTSTISRGERLDLSASTYATALDVVNALIAAKQTKANENASAEEINSVINNLKNAINNVKPAATQTTDKDALAAEVENIIGCIGAITETNYEFKGSAISYAESCVKALGSENIANYATLTAARDAYNAFKGVPEYNYGDVNLDATVDSADALAVLQFAVSKKELTDEQKTIADVTGDGNVDSTDALAILQKCVGKIDKFKVEQ